LAAATITPNSGIVPMRQEASYICDACGEEIVVPLDLTAGASQSYVEDCPVCCRPNLIHVEVDDDGDARIWAEAE
jgi:DNA replicative helicase MCM subunit Mcm2 (Cdc46/Mcm family)